MSKKKDKEEAAVCPVGRLFMDIEEAFEKKSRFFEHLNRSGIELLKAVRSLVDAKIEVLEKCGKEKDRKTATKIEVE